MHAMVGFGPVHFALLNAPYGWVMSNYRRVFIPGGEYFFTANLEDRSGDLLVRHIDDVRAAWRYVEARAPFETVAAVVLPDHLHCIWRLPPGDHDFSTRWRLFKAHFTRAMTRRDASPAGRRDGERGVWQRRFWEHAIRDDRDRLAHVAYIHNNPVKHGHCAHVHEWPYSTWIRPDVMRAPDPVAAPAS